MTDYAGFRKSTDVIDWIRSPPGQQFLKQLEAKLSLSHENLLATCSKTTDPKVAAAVTHWNELATLAAFFRNGRRDDIDR